MTKPRTARVHAMSVAVSVALHVVLLAVLGRIYESESSRLPSDDPFPQHRNTGDPPVELIVLARSGTGVRLDVDAAQPTTDPQPADDGIQPIVGAAGESGPTPDSSAGASTRRRSAFAIEPRDPRLFVATPFPVPITATSRDEVVGRIQNTFLMERTAERGSRQVDLFGVPLTVFGDSVASRSHRLTLDVIGTRVVMPEETREWQQLEISRQRASFARDSMLQERATTRRAAAVTSRPPIEAAVERQ